MNKIDPIQLLFGGMAKLAPGDDEHTRSVLRALPRKTFGSVVDVGCGSGRQTFVLARELAVPIDAVDTRQPFLDDMMVRARELGLDSLVRPHCMDMWDLPSVFKDIELLWSEGAVYNMGFSEALTGWAPAIATDGFAVISECSWLADERPSGAAAFFSMTYPAMGSVDENAVACVKAGYKLLDTYTLPKESWIEGYYDILGTRARTFSYHPDPLVRELALQTLTEIEVFESSQGSYGYVFYVLQKE
jgi:SAM-dependent methyltransferase